MIDAQDAQASGEGISAADTVDFMGETFRLPDKVSFWAYVVFAKASKMGLDSNDDAGMSAMWDMVHGSLAEEDGDRFDRTAMDKRADPDEVFAFVQTIMERVSARPTVSRFGSSQPERKTSKKSKGRARLPDGAETLRPVGELAR